MKSGIGAGTMVSNVYSSRLKRLPPRAHAFTASVVGNSESSDDGSLGFRARRESPRTKGSQREERDP